MSATSSTVRQSVLTNYDHEPKPKSYWANVLENFTRHRMAVVSLGIIVFLCLLAIFADGIAYLLGLDPSSQEILSRYGPASWNHWIGTDEVGRDAFIRLIYGARVSLAVAFISSMASMVIGIIVGSIAGYYGGWMDTLLMRVTDSFLALPLIPILILLAAIDFGKIPVLNLFYGWSR